jgi:hypothetical protein
MSRLKWTEAPTSIKFGDGMVMADVAVGKDHTVTLYCEAQTVGEAEAALSSALGGLTKAAQDVLAERQRQQAKGYDAKHDSQHSADELAYQAAFYLFPTKPSPHLWAHKCKTVDGDSRRTQIVKGVALGLAALERMCTEDAPAFQPPTYIDPTCREAQMVVIERDASGKPTVWCDPEIADLIRALNGGGVRTIASCSGHGEKPGWIALKDGRQLAVVPDLDGFKRLIAADLRAALLRIRDVIADDRCDGESEWANGVNAGAAASREPCIHDPARPEGCWRVRCQLGKVCAAGWKPVPIEPTDEMLGAVMKNYKQHPTGTGWRDHFTRIWQQMVAATPTWLDSAAEADSIRAFLHALQVRNEKDNGLFPQVASEVEADAKALHRVLAVLDFYHPPLAAGAALSGQEKER